MKCIDGCRCQKHFKVGKRCPEKCQCGKHFPTVERGQKISARQIGNCRAVGAVRTPEFCRFQSENKKKLHAIPDGPYRNVSRKHLEKNTFLPKYGLSSKIERRFVWALAETGFQVLHNLWIYGVPDAYMPQLKTMVFADGCFWHRCTECGYPIETARFDLRNKVVNDTKVTLNLLRRGYRVIRIWEHELKQDLKDCVRRVIDTKYKPLYDRVLIKLDNPDKYAISKGGIIMPEEARDMTGIVIEVGMGRVNEQGQTIPLQLKVGHRVMLSRYQGQKIMLQDGSTVYLTREAEISAIIEDE